MQENPLDKIMAPDSVAIVGASNDPLKMGTMQYLNIIYSDYPGQVLPVHPDHDKVFGIKAYKNILDLPFAPELAMLVVPTALVIDMLEDFGKLGTKRAIIISAGFKETGKDGQNLEKRLLETAEKYNMRFLGPNCMGVINARYPFNATVCPLMDKPGFLSIASQSGTYLAQTLGYLRDRGVRLSQAISIGNEASINLVDCLSYLGQDKNTKAIGLYIEALSDPVGFLNVARRISRIKPIVAQYVGGTKAGSKSGLSHTGSIAGPDFLYDGLFEQAGVIRVKSIEEVYRVGHALSAQTPPLGNRMAVLTHSGGPGTAMADMADTQGLVVQELPDDVQEKIRAIIPPHASSHNPVDLTFTTDMTALTEKIPRILLESEAVDGLLIHGIMDTGWSYMIQSTLGKALNVSLEDMISHTKSDIDEFMAMPEKYNKPVVASSFMGLEDNALTVMHENFIPVFDAPEKAAFAMGCLYKYGKIRNRPVDEPKRPLGIGKNAALIIDNRPKGKNLDEHQAKQVLADYGIEVCAELIAGSGEQAVKAAEKIGFPVAIKACSSEILHKTEKNLVHLNISDREGVFVAYDAIQDAAPKTKVLVCEMLSTQREFMAGVTRFENFGPCVLFGLGGVLAEALKDFSLGLAPLSKSDAMSLACSIKAKVLLDNYRNLEEVDKNALASLLTRLSWLALDFPQIKEIDLNPILIKKGRPVVVDALMVL